MVGSFPFQHSYDTHLNSVSFHRILAAQKTRRVPFIAAVFLEPVTIVPPVLSDDPRFAIGRANTRGAMARPFAWPSRDAAVTFLRSRRPWKTWDPRVVRLYLVCISCRDRSSMC